MWAPVANRWHPLGPRSLPLIGLQSVRESSAAVALLLLLVMAEGCQEGSMEKPAPNLSGDSTPDVAEPLSISIVNNKDNDDHDGQISEPHTDEEVVSVPTTPQRQERRFRLKGLLELKTRNKMEEVLEEAMAHSHRCFAAAMNEFSGFAASFGLEGASRCNSAIPQREMERTPLRSDVDTDSLQLDTGNVQDSLPRSEDKPLVTLLSASCVESTAQQCT